MNDLQRSAIQRLTFLLCNPLLEVEFVGPKHPGFDYIMISPNGKEWKIWIGFGEDIWSVCRQRGIVIQSYSYKISS